MSNIILFFVVSFTYNLFFRMQLFAQGIQCLVAAFPVVVRQDLNLLSAVNVSSIWKEVETATSSLMASANVSVISHIAYSVA